MADQNGVQRDSEASDESSPTGKNNQKTAPVVTMAQGEWPNATRPIRNAGPAQMPMT